MTAATPAPLPTPLVLAPDDLPQILAVQINDLVLSSGKTVTGTVVTSTNVAAVEIRVRSMSLRQSRSEPGVWTLSYRVPHLPPHSHRSFTARVVALNSAGKEADSPLALTLR